LPSNASGKRRGNGIVITNCLRGTSGRTKSVRFNAPSFILLPRQLGANRASLAAERHSMVLVAGLAEEVGETSS
jgi:hypothetical protein